MLHIIDITKAGASTPARFYFDDAEQARRAVRFAEENGHAVVAQPADFITDAEEAIARMSEVAP